MIFRCLISLLFGFSLIFSVNANVVCEKPLLTGWSASWEPLVMGSFDNPTGFDKDILQATIDAAGCSLRQAKLAVPWARQLNSIKTGQLDIITGASKTTEREKYAYFTEPYRYESVTIFVLAEKLSEFTSITFKEWITKPVVLGLEYDNFYGEEVKSILSVYPEKIYKVKMNEQNIQKLRSHRIDAYIGFVPAEPIRLNKMGLQEEIVPVSHFKINTGQVHFMLSKKSNNQQVVGRLNEGLKEIKNNGVYEQILRKYVEKYGAIQ